jgi:urease accessory protein UreE
MQNEKAEAKEVLLSEYNKNQFIQLQIRREQLKVESDNAVYTILEALGVDYKDKEVKISPDFSKLIVG